MDNGMTCSTRGDQLEQNWRNWCSGGLLLQSKGPPKGGLFDEWSNAQARSWTGASRSASFPFGSAVVRHRSRLMAKGENRSTGRPSSFTAKLGEVICARLADGRSLRSICADGDMPSATTVFRWLAITIISPVLSRLLRPLAQIGRTTQARSGRHDHTTRRGVSV